MHRKLVIVFSSTIVQCALAGNKSLDVAVHIACMQHFITEKHAGKRNYKHSHPIEYERAPL